MHDKNFHLTLHVLLHYPVKISVLKNSELINITR